MFCTDFGLEWSAINLEPLATCVDAQNVEKSQTLYTIEYSSLVQMMGGKSYKRNVKKKKKNPRMRREQKKNRREN